MGKKYAKLRRCYQCSTTPANIRGGNKFQNENHTSRIYWRWIKFFGKVFFSSSSHRATIFRIWGKKCLLLVWCESDNGLHVLRIYMPRFPKRTTLKRINKVEWTPFIKMLVVLFFFFSSQRDKIASRIQNGADKGAQFVSLKYRWQIRRAKHFWGAKFILLRKYLLDFIEMLTGALRKVRGCEKVQLSHLNLCFRKFPLSDSKWSNLCILRRRRLEINSFWTYRYQILCSELICSEESENNEDHVDEVGKDGRPHIA